MEEEDRHLAHLRAGNDRSSRGGVELEVEVGFELAAAAELRQRLGESCWEKPLWTHELCPQLDGALWINQIDTGWGCWAGLRGEQDCAGPQA